METIIKQVFFNVAIVCSTAYFIYYFAKKKSIKSNEIKIVKALDNTAIIYYKGQFYIVDIRLDFNKLKYVRINGIIKYLKK